MRFAIAVQSRDPCHTQCRILPTQTETNPQGKDRYHIPLQDFGSRGIRGELPLQAASKLRQPWTRYRAMLMIGP